MTLLIIYLRKYCVCCIRSGVTDTPSLWRYTCFICARAGYTLCFCRPSVYLCASLLRSLTVSQDVDTSLSVSLWNDVPLSNDVRLCGTGGFQEQGQSFFIGLRYSMPYWLILFSLSLLSFYRLVLWRWGLWTDRVQIVLCQPCIEKHFLIIIIITIIIIIIIIIITICSGLLAYALKFLKSFRI